MGNLGICPGALEPRGAVCDWVYIYIFSSWPWTSVDGPGCIAIAHPAPASVAGLGCIAIAGAPHRDLWRPPGEARLTY